MYKNIYYRNFHFWHILTISPWPFVMVMFLGALPLGLISYFHGFTKGFGLALLSFVVALVLVFLWFRDIIIESTYQGYHTKRVKQNFYVGFSFFILSEVWLFVAFFWGFFQASLYPSMELNLSWPPVGFETQLINPWNIPFLNTLLLVFSGCTVTLSHLYIRKFNVKGAIISLYLTIYLASTFLFFQVFEYINSSFNISDGMYGTSFFTCTGLHGLHVLFGNLALILCLIRMSLNHFSRNHHVGYELAIWYWHFVDVVWLFLFIIIYVIGNDFAAVFAPYSGINNPWVI